jgi:outer membrane protein assembly factor BamB
MVALAFVHLFFFWGLRAEVDGTGMIPVVYFGTAESHYSELEQHREVQDHQQPPPEGLSVTPVSASSSAPSADARPYWTRFRGPNMDGHYQQMPIRTDWPPEGLPLLWKQPIGRGYASFVLAGGLAFTIEQRRDLEVVAAYELEIGREVWTHSWKAEFVEYEGGDGPRATPTWDEGRLYALGATGELRVLDAESGELIWKRNILSDNGTRNLQYGIAASPLIVDEKVLVLPGGSKGRSVVAYHKLTGEPIWGSLDDSQAYTSPMLVRLAGERQVLVVSRERAMGLRPDDGALLWDYRWKTTYGANVAQPILLGENRFFISAGYGHGAAVVEVTGSEAGFSARTVWENNRMKNKFSSSVLHDGYIYGMDESIMACIDPETGERMWKGGRYGYGEVLLASGHLIVLTEKGDLVLVKATPESHQELARFSAIRGKTWNHPAIADGLLLIRNAREMAAFRIVSP